MFCLCVVFCGLLAVSGTVAATSVDKTTVDVCWRQSVIRVFPTETNAFIADGGIEISPKFTAERCTGRSTGRDFSTLWCVNGYVLILDELSGYLPLPRDSSAITWFEDVGLCERRRSQPFYSAFAHLSDRQLPVVRVGLCHKGHVVLTSELSTVDARIAQGDHLITQNFTPDVCRRLRSKFAADDKATVCVNGEPITAEGVQVSVLLEDGGTLARHGKCGDEQSRSINRMRSAQRSRRQDVMTDAAAGYSYGRDDDGYDDDDGGDDDDDGQAYTH